MPSGGEWITILIVVVVLFGGKKIPELARGIGKGIREFNVSLKKKKKKKKIAIHKKLIINVYH
ncbi:MAG: twin-arginine translocase TatA/TatE family subunit [Chitinophagaceae bacterium]|nr:twin-arginine translocase TatA/TatE family subunit [Chitinophagaceae bacterium]